MRKTLYKVNELARLSGVSVRTLHYYDEIGLLKPLRTEQNGYRIYGQEQVDLLQQILFFRELGMGLNDIAATLNAADFDTEASLEKHLSDLMKKRERLDSLIENVRKSLRSLRGDSIMKNEEKFEGFKEAVIKENKEKYGDEVVEKYGAEAFEGSNSRVAAMSREQWERQEALAREILSLLKAALPSGLPESREAQQAAELHREWLCMFWKPGQYSKLAHLCLAEAYVSDERFRRYYDDAAGSGAAQLLRDAIEVYADKP